MRKKNPYAFFRVGDLSAISQYICRVKSRHGVIIPQDAEGKREKPDSLSAIGLHSTAGQAGTGFSVKFYFEACP